MFFKWFPKSFEWFLNGFKGLIKGLLQGVKKVFSKFQNLGFKMLKDEDDLIAPNEIKDTLRKTKLNNITLFDSFGFSRELSLDNI